jgi:hypothetical protein
MREQKEMVFLPPDATYGSCYVAYTFTILITSLQAWDTGHGASA